MYREPQTRRSNPIRRLAALAAFIATLMSVQAAFAQIDTGRLTPRPSGDLIADDLREDARPPRLRIEGVSEITSSYFHGDSVGLRFSVTVSNYGAGDGNYLLLIDVQGSEHMHSSKPQRVAPGATQQVPFTVAGKFSCDGADRFSVVVTLVDEWSNFNSRGIPQNTRQVDQTVAWVQTSLAKLGKNAAIVDCEGRDPFGGGVVVDADLNVPKMIAFDPDEHGFNFGNSFRNDFITALDIQTGGLCGGMTYAALDYYNSDVALPQQDYRPADHTRLYRYLYDRQADSILRNYDQWFELRQNIGGIRNTTIFNWGLGERIADIREFIDRGEPALLGLKGAHGSGDHQVIAIGYYLGNFRSESGTYDENTRIFVYDPNFPNQTMTLIPHIGRKFYYYAELADELPRDDRRSEEDRVGKYYQGYFVDKSYTPNPPPSIPEISYPDPSLTYELIVAFDTGGDDLRDGSEVDVTVVSRDGSEQFVRNINGTRRWLEDYTQFVQIVLDEPQPFRNLKELRIRHRSGGAGGPDNWDVDKIRVSARGVDRHVVYDVESTPLIRFTGQRGHFTAYLNTAFVPDRHVRQVNLTLRTGGDDLRGGNDNVNAHILFADGSEQLAAVVNNFHPLRNNTSLTYPIVLETPTPPGDIVGVRLEKSRGSDNWNLDSLQVDFVPYRGDTYTRFVDTRAPLVPFTGSDRIREFLFD